MAELDLFRNFRRGVAAPSADAHRRASARLARALDEASGGKHGTRMRVRGGRRRLVVLAAAVLVVVVGAASAFGTVRDLLGNGNPGGERNNFALEGKRGSFSVRILSNRTAPAQTWRLVLEFSPAPDASSDRGSHGPVCASHRARAGCPNRWPQAGVERAPRGLRDPPRRSEAARRDHDEGTPEGCVRAHPARARSPEARLRHADLHVRHRVSQADEQSSSSERRTHESSSGNPRRARSGGHADIRRGGGARRSETASGDQHEDLPTEDVCTHAVAGRSPEARLGLTRYRPRSPRA